MSAHMNGRVMGHVMGHVMGRALDRGGAVRGAALLTSLFLLLAVLIVGVAAARAALDGEKIARAERDRHTAFQAAEAALADAEADIEGGRDPASPRAALFADGSAIGFVAGCGAGQDSVNLGLCERPPAPERPAWQLAELADEQGAANVTVGFGKFTGAFMASGAGTLPARAPRYLIEQVPYVRAGEDAGARAVSFYRVTAIGFGARASTHVVLQTYYRKIDTVGSTP